MKSLGDALLECDLYCGICFKTMRVSHTPYAGVAYPLCGCRILPMWVSHTLYAGVAYPPKTKYNSKYAGVAYSLCGCRIWSPMRVSICGCRILPMWVSICGCRTPIMCDEHHGLPQRASPYTSSIVFSPTLLLIYDLKSSNSNSSAEPPNSKMTWS